MKLSIELGRCFGEVLPPEELNVDFKLDDEDTDPRISCIMGHKHCPNCGNLETVYFIRLVLMNEVPCWISVDQQCHKCHVWFRVKARIYKEEEE